MSELAEPSFPSLQPEAVALLTAIRDHLDVPLYAEGDKKARRAWRNMVEVRVADILAAIADLLAVPAADAADYAQELRRLATEETELATWDSER